MGLKMREKQSVSREYAIRYQRSTKRNKSILLNEFIELTCYRRDYVSLNGQEIVDNSNSPLLYKKPRVAGLIKIFTIDGDSEHYNLKGPRDFNIAKDGTVFIIDQSKALYRFSSSCKYLGNLF